MPPCAVKFADGSDDTLRILAIPYGGPLNGRDTDGECFSDRTDLCLDWFPVQRPLLFEHGIDDGPGASVIGTVDGGTATKGVDGLWVQAQLAKSNRYYDSIKHLIDQGKLFASSGAMSHLVRRGKSGEITRWPWVELSLTPQPANLLAVVEQGTVEKHYKSAGLDADALKAVWSTAEQNDLPDASFAFIEDGGEQDSEGKTTPRSLRHFPYKDASGTPDAAHVRNALARIPQSDLPQAAKDAALTKVRAAAKALGIDAAADGKHAKAVGSTPAEGDDGDAPEGSCEDWIEDVCRAVNGGMLGQGAAGLPTGGYFCTVATFPDYAILRWDDYGPDDGDADGDRFLRVELTKDAQGEPVLGKATPMALQYVPSKSSRLHLMPLALAAGIARKDADALLAHAKAVTQRRIEEGRKAMSDANRGHLEAEVAGLLTAARTLQTFLDSTKPQAKAATDVLHLLELRTRQHRQRMEQSA